MNGSTLEAVELLDWRRQVFDLYHDVRDRYGRDPVGAHRRWRTRRDELVAGHPQSPLTPAARAAFAGLHYFAYDPALAWTARVEPAAEERIEVPASTGGPITFVRLGRVRLPVGTLDVYWLDAYGGGLFLPFRDATAGTETYGGGRYLLDTVKGADLGVAAGGGLVLDFNFAYNPSCSYREDWSCPLPPPGNWLDSRIRAGERAFTPEAGRPQRRAPASSPRRT